MKLIYGVNDRPKTSKLIVFALQQLLSIIAATILVPTLVNAEQGYVVMDQAAALAGAGFGTIVYVLFTKKKSPVFLGSSFAFIPSIIGACAFGFFGIFLGAVIAGIVYVIIAAIINYAGTKWLNKLLPAVVIGPTVALIGLSLAGSAVNNLMNTAVSPSNYNFVHIICGLVTFATVVFASVRGNKTFRLIPFIIGAGAGYVVACLFTIIGNVLNVDYLKVVDFTPLISNFSPLQFSSFFDLPDFTFMNFSLEGIDGAAIGQIALLYAPVAFVVLAEHIADHKNLSTIIEHDLIEDPGLSRTLLGDGVGSIVGAFVGSCPNTSYGESVGCVAITKNASIWSIILAAIFCIVLSFFSPFVALVNTIPSSIVGGLCLALYGFIAVSGLKMLKDVDLGNSKNLFVVSAILVSGIGGLTFKFGDPLNPTIQITSIAVALILGILVNVFVKEKAVETDEDNKVEITEKEIE